jgi:hypothetical protein
VEKTVNKSEKLLFLGTLKSDALLYKNPGTSTETDEPTFLLTSCSVFVDDEGEKVDVSGNDGDMLGTNEVGLSDIGKILAGDEL